MKTIHNTKIIGIDHGYGNMKTANHCFLSGILSFDAEPLFTGDMLTYNGKYYLIGEGHKEFIAEKVNDEDYYILTLAAIAKELKAEKLTEAHIVIAAGLPLTWTSGQKADFKEYLMKMQRWSSPTKRRTTTSILTMCVSIRRATPPLQVSQRRLKA